MSTSSTDVLVLGAGYAGLTAAALLAADGRDVTVLEGHATLGGCGSFFREGAITFDVGATTFSGVEEHQPVGRVFARLGIVPELVRQDPGVIVRMEDGEIVRHADPVRWIDEAARLFPVGDQRGFWQRLYEIERKAYRIVLEHPVMPPATVGAALRMLRPRYAQAAGLVGGLLRPMQQLMRRYGVDRDPRFMRFVNEQLLISTQNHASHAPYVPAAMGLTYPSSTWYPVGGMFRPALLMMRSLTDRGGVVRFRRHVTSIDRHNGAWEVRTSNGETYRARSVVSSIPVWNMARLTHGRVQRWMEMHALRHRRIWSAVTVYLAVEGRPALPTAYYQLHATRPLPYCASDSIFVSVSRPDDDVKAPPGITTVTISTHVRWEDWSDTTPATHAERKRMVTDAILAEVERLLPEIGTLPRVHVSSGTPHTWVHYTQRMHGYVGGIPHDIRRPMLLLPPNVTPFEGLYMVGDNAFPGQGTPAVMLGAMNIARIFAGHE